MPSDRCLRAAVIAVCLAAVAAPAAAEPDVETLERRVEELERREAERQAADAKDEESADSVTAASLAEWAKRVRVGGSVKAGFYKGQTDSPLANAGFQVRDARFFIDAELGEDLRLGETTVVRNVGVTFEWDLVRIGTLRNTVGEVYVEMQGLGDSSWANAQIGRFQVPVGEAYLLYSRGAPNNPFVSTAVGGPWWWDEGVKLYGSSSDGRFGYVASISAGETPFNVDVSGDQQLTLKLIADPLPWLHLSLSGLRSGRIGSPTVPASGALWLGESWARAFGSGSPVTSYVKGLPAPDGPNQLRDSYLLGGDVILQQPDCARLWLGYGAYHIDSRGPSFYDRTLHYWIAELVVEGAAASRWLSPFYAGARASGVGTYDRNRGYLLDFRYGGSLGYNMRKLEEYAFVIGWRMTRWLTLRTEYAHQRIGLVRGVTPAIAAAANATDWYGIELGAHF